MTLEVIGPSLAEVEREHILETLSRCRGNRTHTAKVLRISVRSLRMKLQCYAHSGSEVTAPGTADARLAQEIADGGSAERGAVN